MISDIQGDRCAGDDAVAGSRHTTITAGFPGVGKSHFAASSPRVVLDSDSSGFSRAVTGVRHPLWPRNYLEHIKGQLGRADIILVSSHQEVRDALREAGLHYTLVYPSRRCKAEYIERFERRGSSKTFIDAVASNWDVWLDAIEAETFPLKHCIGPGLHLSDALDRPPGARGAERESADRYQQLALRTASGRVTPGQAKAFGLKEGDALAPELQRLNWALGAAGEAGEIADLMKKQIFHDHPVDRDKMLKEWGDLLWYVAVGAHWDGFKLSEVMAANIQKLQVRYPAGFSPQASLERTL